MSVQKFIVSKGRGSYTTIPNTVIDGLKNNIELLGFYLYLLHLPPDWIFYKTELKHTLQIGVKKLERYLAQLAQMNLVICAKTRNEKGQFAHFNLMVLDGTEFKNNNLAELSTQNAQPCVKNRTTVTRTTDMGSYKGNIDKRNKETKNKDQKLSSAPDGAGPLDDLPFFTIFWAMYPKKKDRLRAKEVWIKKNLETQGEQILDGLNMAIRNEVQWRDKQFIPEPAKWLRNERWEDEIVSVKDLPAPKNETPMQRAGRMFSELRNG